MQEELTAVLSGSFTYGYRDVPIREGERLDRIAVLENGRTYRPGASTALEPGGPPGTFGVEDRGDTIRIVWRFETDGGVSDVSETPASGTGSGQILGSIGVTP